MSDRWVIDWDYWEAQIEGFNQLKKKKKIWREYRNETKELMKRFDLFCDTFCNKKNEIEKKFNKLFPKNAESNN